MLQNLSDDESMRYAAQKREMFLQDQLAREENQYGEGLREGKEAGIKEGLEKGIKEGMEKGMEKGKREGIKEGEIKAKVEIVNNLQAFGMNLEEALKAAKMDKETFLKLKEKYEPVQTK